MIRSWRGRRGGSTEEGHRPEAVRTGPVGRHMRPGHALRVVQRLQRNMPTHASLAARVRAGRHELIVEPPAHVGIAATCRRTVCLQAFLPTVLADLGRRRFEGIDAHDKDHGRRRRRFALRGATAILPSPWRRPHQETVAATGGIAVRVGHAINSRNVPEGLRDCRRFTIDLDAVGSSLEVCDVFVRQPGGVASATTAVRREVVDASMIHPLGPRVTGNALLAVTPIDGGSTPSLPPRCTWRRRWRWRWRRRWRWRWIWCGPTSTASTEVTQAVPTIANSSLLTICLTLAGDCNLPPLCFTGRACDTLVAVAATLATRFPCTVIGARLAAKQGGGEGCPTLHWMDLVHSLPAQGIGRSQRACWEATE